jgi:adenine phosphoribosyltransferase
VVLVDDLSATGGTAMAGVALLRGEGAVVTQARFLVDLPDLGGAARLAAAGVQASALLAYAGD